MLVAAATSRYSLRQSTWPGYSNLESVPALDGGFKKSRIELMTIM
jgi:hypothetical protein